MTNVTKQLIDDHYRYDHELGGFFHNKKRQGVCVGKKAGRVLRTGGYREVSIFGQIFLEHRLVWFYFNGCLPECEIDHINGNRTDNRIENLRLADRAFNSQNQRAAQRTNKSSGLLGVSFHKRHQKYRAQITVNKKPIWLGLFETAEEAHEAYLSKKRELHEGCTI